MEALQSDAAPNSLVLGYTANWQINNLLLVPSFFFSPSSIERRNPLSLTSRRPGCVGCNILLSAIAPEGKLRLINNGVTATVLEVRRQHQQMRPLSQIAVPSRGWTLDVLQVVSSFGKRVFTLSEVYSFETHLADLHPENHRVREKIRQQLQVLRDLNLLQFLGHGSYRLVDASL